MRRVKSARLSHSEAPGPHRPSQRVIETLTLTMDLDPFFGLKGLTAYSSLSRRTLQSLINASQDPLPSYRVGAKILVRKSEFDRWMARRRNRKPLDAVRLAAADARALLTARPQNAS